MGRNDEPSWKKERRQKQRGQEIEPGIGPSGGGEHAGEKQKARDLRKSPWWKKKTAAGRCYYCSGIFPPSELTMDHIIPLSKGVK